MVSVNIGRLRVWVSGCQDQREQESGLVGVEGEWVGSRQPPALVSESWSVGVGRAGLV